ncbi:MAG: DeoR/GlpR family DNA-binding transcription regulator [Mangrovicoccus sp.]
MPRIEASVTLKPEDRRADMVAWIARAGELSVETLSAHYNVSLETVRRDLTRLSDAGRVRKVHGGARRPQLHTEPSFSERIDEDAGEKQILGQKLRDQLGPGDTLFIDTGTTTLFACEGLTEIDDLTVVTNSLLIAQKLGATGKQTVYLLGGQYGAVNKQTLGVMVIDQINCFQTDHAVMTLSGIDAEAGVTYSDIGEAEIARAMIARTGNVIFLAHSSKFARRAAFRTCGLEAIDTLLSATPPPPTLADALSAAKVRVL